MMQNSRRCICLMSLLIISIQIIQVKPADIIITISGGGLTQSETEITQICVTHIRNNNINLAIDAFKRIDSLVVLENIIKNTYEIKNIIYCLTFIQQLIDININRYSIAYIYLLDQMISANDLDNPEIFLLAFAIKNNLKHCHLCEDTLATLKNRLPKMVRLIVWSLPVCIKSVHFDEFLYAEDSLFRTDKRLIVTKIADKTSRPTKGARWQFEPIENGTYFNLKNIDYNEYLYAIYDGSTYDKSRRYVVTWVPGTVDATGKWKLEVVDENSINLRNFQYNFEYLYPAQIEYDSSKRYIFTWRDGGCDGQCPWKIIEC